MIAELGLLSLIIAFLFACLLGTIPLYGLLSKKERYIVTAPFYVRAQVIFILFSFFCLVYSFLQDDFTLSYVLSNSAVNLPWFYKACAVWGGHEGSMLLWVTILSVWMLLVSIFAKDLERQFKTRVLIVLAWVAIGFFLFLLLVSNPFLRQFQILETNGRDLNPLLQDPGFLFHPPMLYMGYVGFSVAFAFAIAALWSGRLESTWTKWARPWTLAAWSFLSAGITLGSLWAYRELGWGGWWFWDPVENASFMPWLTGTALIHSLFVSEKRQQFMAWTLFLAITAFSLSLIGTFLVRSGILTSVHAFAVDPQRGLFILCYLGLVIGGALSLFAFRAKTISKPKKIVVFSKETALVLNNIFFFVIMLTVLLGTLYPLIIDGLNLGKISVGAPYFNSVFVPLFMGIGILMGIGLHLNWQQDTLKALLKKLSAIFWLSLILTPCFLLFFFGTIQAYAFLGLSLGLWVILSTLKALFSRKNKSISFWAMVIAHLGVAITIIGISISTSYSLEEERRISPGDSLSLGQYNIKFVEEKPLLGPNFRGREVEFELKDSKGHLSHLFPQKRIYTNGDMVLTESAIDYTLFRDIYVALGEPLDDDSWSVRIYYKPLIRWIWLGGFMILIGGLFAIVDKRYFKKEAKSLIGLETVR